MLSKLQMFKNQTRTLVRGITTSSVYKKPCILCHSNIKDQLLFCPESKCQAIQPLPETLDYFGAFGCPSKYKIDQGSLKLQFFKYQRLAHPDNFYRQPEDQRLVSETTSSWLNRAYETLKDPLLRAQYLLELKGQPIGEGEQIKDQMFLLDIMELNEELEEATTQEELIKIKTQLRDRVNGVEKQLEEAFDKNDIENAKQLAIELKYIKNVHSSVSQRS